MPRGFEGVRRAKAEVEAKRKSGPGAGALWFRLKPDEEREVRFLEQDDDIAYAMCHEVPVENRAWGRDVPCLNQNDEGGPCPGCERDLPRRFRGYINLIDFNAPVFKRDANNKIVKDRLGDAVITGTQPQVALWSSGVRLFETLDEINANYRGLRSRRFKVKRRGEGTDTTYHITPADVDSGPQDFSAEELKLEEGKLDLGPMITPGSYEEFLKELGAAPAVVGHGQGDSPAPATAQAANPFMRK